MNNDETKCCPPLDAFLPLGGIHIPVCIIEHRCNFGRVDVHVSPVGGYGTIWVNERSLVMPRELEPYVE